MSHTAWLMQHLAQPGPASPSNGCIKPGSPRLDSELSVTVTQQHLSLSFPRVNITHTHTRQALSLVMNPDSEDKLLWYQAAGKLTALVLPGPVGSACFKSPPREKSTWMKGSKFRASPRAPAQVKVKAGLEGHQFLLPPQPCPKQLLFRPTFP